MITDLDPRWELIGGCPSPGDPDAVGLVARACILRSELAGGAREGMEAFGSAVAGSAWAGVTAEVFLDRLGAVLPSLADATDRFHHTGQALLRWSAALDGLRGRARSALQAAEAARDRRVQGEADLEQADQMATAARARLDAVEQAIDRASRDTGDRESLIAARHAAVELADRWHRARLDAQNRIDRAVADLEHARDAAAVIGAEHGQQAAAVTAAVQEGTQEGPVAIGFGDALLGMIDESLLPAAPTDTTEVAAVLAQVTGAWAPQAVATTQVLVDVGRSQDLLAELVGGPGIATVPAGGVAWVARPAGLTDGGSLAEGSVALIDLPAELSAIAAGIPDDPVVPVDVRVALAGPGTRPPATTAAPERRLSLSLPVGWQVLERAEGPWPEGADAVADRRRRAAHVGLVHAARWADTVPTADGQLARTATLTVVLRRLAESRLRPDPTVLRAALAAADHRDAGCRPVERPRDVVVPAGFGVRGAALVRPAGWEAATPADAAGPAVLRDRFVIGLDGAVAIVDFRTPNVSLHGTLRPVFERIATTLEVRPAG